MANKHSTRARLWRKNSLSWRLTSSFWKQAFTTASNLKKYSKILAAETHTHRTKVSRMDRSLEAEHDEDKESHTYKLRQTVMQLPYVSDASSYCSFSQRLGRCHYCHYKNCWYCLSSEKKPSSTSKSVTTATTPRFVYEWPYIAYFGLFVGLGFGSD